MRWRFAACGGKWFHLVGDNAKGLCGANPKQGWRREAADIYEPLRCPKCLEKLKKAEEKAAKEAGEAARRAEFRALLDRVDAGADLASEIETYLERQEAGVGA